MKLRYTAVFVSVCCLAITACNKEDNYLHSKSEDVYSIVTKPKITNPSNLNLENTLTYGDSIFYISDTASNIIFPTYDLGKGKYIGFPGGLEIDSRTGAIDLAECETGLRYKVMFVPEHSIDTLKVKIVISGINFYDHIFNLSKGDSIANAIYNASGIPFVPGQFGIGNNCVFDDGNGCAVQGFSVNPVSGHINLAQSIRNGALPFKNNSVTETVYNYRMDDLSGGALNKLKVKVYLYNTVNDIPTYLWNILNERNGTILPAVMPSSGLRAKATSPRPPCLIIVMN